MLLYVLLFAYATVCIVQTKEALIDNKKVLIFFLLLPLFFISAFRGISVGPDTHAYHFIYNSIARSESLFKAISSNRSEPGYVFINYIFSRFGLSYYYLQVFVSLFILVSIGLFLYRYSDDVCFSVFLLFADCSFLGMMNVVRMWIAIAVLLFSVEALKSDSAWKFILIVLIACSFHYSSALFIVMYPLMRMDLTKRRIVMILFASLLLCIFVIPLFRLITTIIGRYGEYIESERFKLFGNLATILSLFVSLFFFAFESYEKAWIKDNHDEDGICISQHEYSVAYRAIIVAVAISIVGLSNNIMGRLIHYFSIFDLLLIPHAINRIEDTDNRILIRAAVVLIMLLEFIVINLLRPDWYQVMPYSFFFM